MRFFLVCYLLELVGATVVTALGWVACRMQDLSWISSGPLWFAGYLFVYNADRLFPDPADEFNTPLRQAWHTKLRGCRRLLLFFSALILLVWPLVTQRAWLLAPILLSVFLLYFYSRPMPWICFRWKNLPYVKSLIAPIVIAAALVLWPAFESGRNPDGRTGLVFLWVFLLLTMNSLVFDHRDIQGDRRTGTRTIPSLLGWRTSQLLLALLAIGLVLCSCALCRYRMEDGLLPVSLAAGCGALLILVIRQKASPLLLSVCADALLLLPALVELASRLARDDLLNMR